MPIFGGTKDSTSENKEFFCLLIPLAPKLELGSNKKNGVYVERETFLQCE